jgi:protein-S-isoprenylcysteine O-methyltransferase Ste14
MNAARLQFLWAILGTLIYLLLLLPFFLIWIPYRILLSPEQIYVFDIGVFRYLGLVPIALGVIIYVFCSLSFVFIGKGTPVPFTPTKELIVTGLYRFVRNPLYIAGVFVLTGEALLFQSIGIFFYCLIMFGGFNLHVLMEETQLADKFGKSYEQYRDSVPRWIPRLKPYRDSNAEPQ